MEIISSYLLSLLYMIVGLLTTGVVIFIHELGHYWAASIMKVNVEILSFGFGRPVFSYMGKKTEFRISLIPFGGYCRLGGSEDLTVALSRNEKKMNYAEEGSLFAITPFKKLFIYIAGPLMNIILAYILFLFVSLIPVERVSNEAIITPVSEYSVLFDVDIAQSALCKGDIVLKADEKEILDYEDLENYLKERNGDRVTLTLLRDGKKREEVITPEYIDGRYTYGITNLVLPVIGRSENDEINTGDRIIECNGRKIEYDLDLLSIDSDVYTLLLIDEDGREKRVTLETKSFPFAFASSLRNSRESGNPFKLAYERTKAFLSRTAKAITKLMTLHIKDALEEISGPFTSASNMGKISFLAFNTSSSSGVRTLLYLMAVVSVSIAVGNMIPIPTFDGGQIFICLAEIIYHRPLKPRAYLVLHIAGVVLAWTIVIVMNSYSFLEKLL